MQQVHEGAYDFSRYTVLGHRFLFRKFECIDMGGNKGAGIALSWSFGYFIWALTRSRKIGPAFQILSKLLIQPFEAIISKKSLYDSSSGVFF